MESQRTLLGLVIAMAVVGTAAAQTAGALRWRSTPLGLQASSDRPLPCASYTLSCSGATALPLYTSVTAPRSLSMQLSDSDRAGALHPSHSQGLNVSLVGKAGFARDFGVYGRVGTTLNRSSPALAASIPADGGLTYGVGLSWDFTRSASAAVGLDSYDIRSFSGDSRDLRTSLGLQWRY